MSKTETVYNILRKRLEMSLYPPGSRFPSESTLAGEFSVNKMTMNKIVSMLVERGFLVRGRRGSGTLVADYRAKARGLIAFLGNIHTYSALVLRGVVAEAARNNFMVITETPRIEELQHRLELLKSQGVTGIISMGYGVPDVPEDMRLICVDANTLPDPAGKVSVINSDNFQGGALMMKEILRRGHRDILIFSSERFVMNRDASITPRVQGFHSVMRSCGIRDFEARTFYSAPSSAADCREFLRSCLKKYPGATLIAADSDYAAELLYKEAHFSGSGLSRKDRSYRIREYHPSSHRQRGSGSGKTGATGSPFPGFFPGGRERKITACGYVSYRSGKYSHSYK